MGVCHFACSIFCLLAGVILTVFWLITAGDDESNTNLTFMIVAIKNDWDLKEKSHSCRNGAFIYYGLAVLLVIWGIISNKREESRIAEAKRERLSRRIGTAGSVDTPLLEAQHHHHGGMIADGTVINNGSTASSFSGGRKEARQSEDTDASLLAHEGSASGVKKY